MGQGFLLKKLHSSISVSHSQSIIAKERLDESAGNKLQELLPVVFVFVLTDEDWKINEYMHTLLNASLQGLRNGLSAGKYCVHELSEPYQKLDKFGAGIADSTLLLVG